MKNGLRVLSSERMVQSWVRKRDRLDGNETVKFEGVGVRAIDHMYCRA